MKDRSDERSYRRATSRSPCDIDVRNCWSKKEGNIFLFTPSTHFIYTYNHVRHYY